MQNNFGIQNTLCIPGLGVSVRIIAGHSEDTTPHACNSRIDFELNQEPHCWNDAVLVQQAPQVPIRVLLKGTLAADVRYCPGGRCFHTSLVDDVYSVTLNFHSSHLHWKRQDTANNRQTSKSAQMKHISPDVNHNPAPQANTQLYITWQFNAKGVPH